MRKMSSHMARSLRGTKILKIVIYGHTNLNLKLCNFISIEKELNQFH